MKELGCDKKNIIKVFNKVDLVTDKNKIHFVSNKYKNNVIISAQRGINISRLEDKLIEVVEESFVDVKVAHDLAVSKKAAAIHSMAKVLSTKYDDKSVHITYRTKKENSDKIKKLIYGK